MYMYIYKSGKKCLQLTVNERMETGQWIHHVLGENDLCWKLHVSQLDMWRIKCLSVKATSLGGPANRSWWSFTGDHSELLHKWAFIKWELWSFTDCDNEDTKQLKERKWKLPMFQEPLNGDHNLSSASKKDVKFVNGDNIFFLKLTYE